jgi:hypothetical protein
LGRWPAVAVSRCYRRSGPTPRLEPAGWRPGLLLHERAKVNSRYAILGFRDKARLDDGSMWPVVYALPELTPADEARIAALVTRAVG